MIENVLANARDMGSISGSGRSPGRGNGNPLQYSCLGNLMDRRALWAVVHGVSKSWTLHMHTRNCILVLNQKVKKGSHKQL